MIDIIHSATFVAVQFTTCKAISRFIIPMGLLFCLQKRGQQPRLNQSAGYRWGLQGNP